VLADTMLHCGGCGREELVIIQSLEQFEIIFFLREFFLLESLLGDEHSARSG